MKNKGFFEIFIYTMMNNRGISRLLLKLAREEGI